MSSQDAFFKIRPTKRSNPEARTTLDILHQAHVKELTGTSGDAILDYFLNAGDIVYNYYETQDKISMGIEPSVKRATVKAKPGSVLAALEQAASTGGLPDTPAVPQMKREMLRRDKLLEEYLLKIHPEHARGNSAIQYDSYGECAECDQEMIFSANEALFTCTNCGNQQFILVDSDKPSYKDPPREISYYAYKRINHFNEWLAQFQAKETTEIPQEIFELIQTELKKERIIDTAKLKPSKLREILKKLKLSKYYEHVAHIMNRLNGVQAPVLSREVEDKLRFMFREIQPSFIKHCPKGRSNFLSYSYVLYKFCQLLELDEFLPCFPLLKSREKLYMQDKIWQCICEDMGWEFIKSI